MTCSIKELTHPYLQTPPLYAIACGVGFGAARIFAGHALSKYPFFAITGVISTSPLSSLLAVAYLILRGIAVPFFEEAVFRANLTNPTAEEILKNSALFGLLHGLLPGSLEARLTHIVSSAIGGIFYCGARSMGGNLWSSAIAHSMYNLRSLITG